MPQKPARLSVASNLSADVTKVHCPFVTSHPKDNLHAIKGFCALLIISRRKTHGPNPKRFGPSSFRGEFIYGFKAFINNADP